MLRLVLQEVASLMRKNQTDIQVDAKLRASGAVQRYWHNRGAGSRERLASVDLRVLQAMSEDGLGVHARDLIGRDGEPALLPALAAVAEARGLNVDLRADLAPDRFNRADDLPAWAAAILDDLRSLWPSLSVSERLLVVLQATSPVARHR